MTVTIEIPISVLPIRVYRVREAKGVIIAQPGNKSLAFRSTTQINSFSLTYRRNNDRWCLAASNLHLQPSRDSFKDLQLFRTRACFACAKKSDPIPVLVKVSIKREASNVVRELSDCAPVLCSLNLKKVKIPNEESAGAFSKFFVLSEKNQSALKPLIDLKFKAVMSVLKFAFVSSSGK